MEIHRGGFRFQAEGRNPSGPNCHSERTRRQIAVICPVVSESLNAIRCPLHAIFAFLPAVRNLFYPYAFGVLTVCFLIACPVGCAVCYPIGAASGSNSATQNSTLKAQNSERPSAKTVTVKISIERLEKI